LDRRDLLRKVVLAFGVLALAPLATASPLPSGVRVVWDLDKAYRETTATRERVCLNGLWRWQPAGGKSEIRNPKSDKRLVPADGWGYFKVPGFWPGRANYLQEDSQTLSVHPQWKDTDLHGITTAWYQREVTIPKRWTGRRIALAAEYVNSLAVVYVDGKKVGVVRYPAGDADLTAACRPGSKHILSLLVVAMPLKAVLLSHTDTNSAKQIKGSVERRGLCGDVYLVSTPAAARITDVQVATSVRRGEITLCAALQGLAPKEAYTLGVEVRERGRAVREFTSKPFQTTDLPGGRIAVSAKWKPAKLWDLPTPQNMYTAHVSLRGPDAKACDTYYDVHFGFREFWIDGRDFFLNGTRIYLSAVPLDNAQIGARTATYRAVRETLQRLQSLGINFVYTHNYGCEPGSHVSFAEVLRAADDVGMLVAFSQPHFAHYDWKAPDADRTNGYARHAACYVRAAQHHPSVVAYSMSHNATGYDEDMNPDLIDGIHDPRERWGRNYAQLALRAEAIVKSLDPSRIVYHHSSGNLGSMHTVNFYPNFAPIQELSDWLEHWATKGVKPVFFCEYGAPFSWDWMMYRGWYRGKRTFGSARVPWEFCLAEWNAQFLGDRAYRVGAAEKANLRWEARQFRAGTLWHRWDYPHPAGSSVFTDQQAVSARYLADNWRAQRTWGISANSPWEYEAFWKLRGGVPRKRQEFKVDWTNLQRPGFRPDYAAWRQGQMATDLERSDWVATEAGRALLRNNRPLLAYIAGKAGQFTSKDHNFVPGERVEKQLIVINNSRASVSCACEWSLALPRAVTGHNKVSVLTGAQERIPLRFELPASLAPGTYQLTASVHFSSGETQKDSFSLHVLPRPSGLSAGAKIALFDPKGDTAQALAALHVRFQRVKATTDLSAYDVLIVGKEALTCDGPGPDIGRVREGLKVVLFEQTAKALEQRLGFRVAEYGLRQVFPRVPDHPLLAGLEAEHWRDWRGSATLSPPRLQYSLRPRYGPTVRWCGFEVPRVWRCGCRGNVASVLIEKPARGDFLPILDGGFGLQYSPLLKYHEGKGMVLFCQLDVTGRTAPEPVADRLVRHLLRYVSTWKPRPSRKAFYVGTPAGKKHLAAAGLSLGVYTKKDLTPDRVLVVGAGGGQRLAADASAIGRWLQEGGHLLALGLDGADAKVLLPFQVELKKREHIAVYFAAPGRNSPLAGIGPADVHNRDPRQLPLVTAGATVIGNGVLAKADNAHVVFCQLVPWQFQPHQHMNVKRTFRRVAYLVNRLAANMGIAGPTPILARFHQPAEAAGTERRWLDGLYLDVPEEWDDPYRFFRW
jgi:beta-galactosidase/beta-glucuronidase